METPIRRSIRLATSTSKSQRVSNTKVSPRDILAEVTNQLQDGQRLFNSNSTPIGSARKPKSARASSSKRQSSSAVVVSDHSNPFWYGKEEEFEADVGSLSEAVFHASADEDGLVMDEQPPDQFLDDRFLTGTESPASQGFQSTPTTAATANVVSAASSQFMRSARQRKSASKSLKSSVRKPSGLSKQISMDDSDGQVPEKPASSLKKDRLFIVKRIFYFALLIFTFIGKSVWKPIKYFYSKVQFPKIRAIFPNKFTVPRMMAFSQTWSAKEIASKFWNYCTRLFFWTFSRIKSFFGKIYGRCAKYLGTRSDLTRSRLHMLGFIFVMSSIFYWIKTMGVFYGVPEMIDDTVSRFDLGSYAKSYDEINDRFERLETALISVIDDSRTFGSKYASKKDLLSLESNLKELSITLDNLYKKGTSSPSTPSSMDNEYKEMFAKWAELSKSEFGDLIEKYPSLSEKIDSLQQEIKNLGKKTKDHEESIARISEELKGLGLLEQRLSLLVLKELDKAIPSRVIGYLSNDKVELHPKFLSFLKEEFLQKNAKKIVDEKEINLLVNNALDRQSLSKKEILKHFEKEIRDIMNKVNSLTEQSEKITLIKSEIENIRKSSSNATLSLENKAVSDVIKGMIDQIVGNALERYSADRIALPDYALASTGSRVVPSMTSPTYRSPQGLLASLLNLGVAGKPPVVALLPDVSLGNCWSFNGNKANFTVALAKAIIPTDFTIEHVSKSLSLDVSSAPKALKIYGIPDSVKSSSAQFKLIGEYEYDPFGNSIQTFPAKLPLSNEPIRMVQLRILSNHGNSEFTCLYRFRVHSK